MIAADSSLQKFIMQKLQNFNLVSVGRVLSEWVYIHLFLLFDISNTVYGGYGKAQYLAHAV